MTDDQGSCLCVVSGRMQGAFPCSGAYNLCTCTKCLPSFQIGALGLHMDLCWGKSSQAQYILWAAAWPWQAALHSYNKAMVLAAVYVHPTNQCGVWLGTLQEPLVLQRCWQIQYIIGCKVPAAAAPTVVIINNKVFLISAKLGMQSCKGIVSPTRICMLLHLQVTATCGTWLGKKGANATWCTICKARFPTILHYGELSKLPHYKPPSPHQERTDSTTSWDAHT